ncbi:2-aminobenzoate-CoA ligase [Enemella dayhoffiae]|uniref:2-aminobenzoate-CoA ligase n=2 Tax=Enemella dayhoffiae TaxID=2016507 RepID=A0A255HD28_9ACTN|nr:2-aminobenzoate-CoA ligase [Enemella dayhoffiae]
MELHPTAHQDTCPRDSLPPDERWPRLEFTLPELNYPERLNAAGELIDRAVAEHGADRLALLTPDGERWSYGDLQRRANQVAQVLTEDFGVVPGNRVMLRSPNNPWTVACWLGVLKAGGVVVTTMFALRAHEIEPLIRVTRPVVAISDHRFVDALRDAVVASDYDLRLVTFGGDRGDDLVRLAEAKSGEFTNVDTASDDIALFGPTSGSTGVPKITMHFHRDILANADTFAKHVLKPRADDVFACSAPFAFTFGLGALVVFPLRVGAASLLTERATPVELADLVAEHGVTCLFTAPTAYRQILKEHKEDALKGVRRAVSAGEHLPEDVWHEVHERTGLKLIDGIGATELLHIFISAADDDIRPGATGKPVPGFRAKIVDAEGIDAPVGELGRLAVIGPIGCRYLKDDRQLDYVQDGWNLTGDTFRMDEDGYFWYSARSDNMIISSGYNIGGPEVEMAVDQHPDVAETAVVGRPDPDRGSVVCAFVVLRDGVVGDDAKRKEIQDFVKQQIAPYKYPRDVRFVSALPRNPSGKLQHFKLRERLAAEADTDKNK